MKYFICGTGFVFPRHVQAIAKVKGEFAEIVNGNRNIETWKEAIDKADYDVAVILTPPDFHYPMILRAMERNKIILCEKPLVINEQDLEAIKDYDKLYTVAQLRYLDIGSNFTNLTHLNQYDINMRVAVHRDADYFKKWQGQPMRSGGILYNLGIHYFDLLLHIFGPALNVLDIKLDDKNASGVIVGANYNARFYFSTDTAENEQERVFSINGREFDLAGETDKLYQKVYQDLERGKGVKVQDVISTINLIEKIKYEAR